ncbi:Protein of unknown function, partial [Gryllus bimaculatus]
MVRGGGTRRAGCATFYRRVASAVFFGGRVLPLRRDRLRPARCGPATPCGRAEARGGRVVGAVEASSLTRAAFPCCWRARRLAVAGVGVEEEGEGCGRRCAGRRAGARRWRGRPVQRSWSSRRRVRGACGRTHGEWAWGGAARAAAAGGEWAREWGVSAGRCAPTPTSSRWRSTSPHAPEQLARDKAASLTSAAWPRNPLRSLTRARWSRPRPAATPAPPARPAPRADGGDAQAKERARELALRYAFVTSVTSLVVVKPDDQTGVADLRDADECALPSLMSVAQPSHVRSWCGPQMMCSTLRSCRFISAPSPLYQSSCAYTATNYDANLAVPNYTGALALQDGVESGNSSFSEEGVWTFEDPRGDIKSLEVRCDVVHRYARAEVLGAVENPADESKVLMFGVLLPEEAFISGFE